MQVIRAGISRHRMIQIKRESSSHRGLLWPGCCPNILVCVRSISCVKLGRATQAIRSYVRLETYIYSFVGWQMIDCPGLTFGHRGCPEAGETLGSCRGAAAAGLWVLRPAGMLRLRSAAEGVRGLRRIAAVFRDDAAGLWRAVAGSGFRG
jgi:hypothetical protein